MPGRRGVDAVAALGRSWCRRPRLIYVAVFAWISITGGRFTASFLEAESSWIAAAAAAASAVSTEGEDSVSSPAPLDPGQIGTVLAIQRLVSVFVGSVTGIWADRMEARYPKRGRILLLGFSCSLGTLVFLFHGVHRFGIGDTEGRSAFQSFYWFLFLRALYAIVTSSVFPVMDGICLDFLKNDKSTRSRKHRYDSVPDGINRHDGSEETKDEEPTTPSAAAAVAQEDATDDYGKERLYGAISWAVTNLVLGPVLDRYRGDFWALYPLSVLSTVVLWCSIAVYLRSNRHREPSVSNPRRLPKRDSNVVLPDCTDDDEDNPFRGDQEIGDKPIAADALSGGSPSKSSGGSGGRLSYYLSVLAVFCATRYTVAFLVCATTLASGQAIVNDLIFLFFEFLGSSYTLLSATVFLTVVFEIPVFQVAPQLLRRFGCDGLLVIAALAYVIRVLGYTLVPQDQPIWVLWLEPLHGITYACSQTASVSFVAKKLVFSSSNNSNNNSNSEKDGNRDANGGKTDGNGSSSSSKNTNDGFEATGQGFLQFFLGIGSVLGLQFGGILEDRLGPRSMYRVSAIVVAMGCAVFVATLVLTGRRPPRQRTAGHQAVPQLEDAVIAATGDTAEGTENETGAVEMIVTNEASSEK